MANESLVTCSMNKVGRIAAPRRAPDKQILRDPQASLGIYYATT